MGDQRQRGLRRTVDAIGKIAGHKPPTCPWRAQYDPLVKEVLQVVPFAHDGNLGAAWGDDPPHLLVAATAVYLGAVAATRAEEDRLHYEELKRNQKQRAQGGRRGH